jgi:ATP-dependent exoDNAse (exonuclease V) alpha subunit
MQAIARDYAAQPESTLVISPDNKSRAALNQTIRSELQERGVVGKEEQRVRVLAPRQDMTGADRAWAAQYERGDVVRYTKGSRTMNLDAGEYARVVHRDAERNQVTVERKNGERVSYDPRRLQGVTVYRESERSFSQGDRVQFTAPDAGRRIANRELGTVERIDKRGDIEMKLDSGRNVRFNVKENPHVDHGYAVTSHSSQGATADRVLVHVDSDQGHGKLINSRLAYVSVSRARYDAQIYTNDAGTLGRELSREVSHPAAVTQSQEQSAANHRSSGEKKPAQAEHSQAGSSGPSQAPAVPGPGEALGQAITR